jgi:hypothetical protein
MSSMLHQAALVPHLAVAEPVVLCPQVVGPFLTLAGFPPFQACSAELYCLGPIAGVQEVHVAQALARYSRVSQRFGK